MYKVMDNKGNLHDVFAKNDNAILMYMRIRYIDFIVSILSSDPIVVYRPNGYILAYIKCSTGEQTIKTMADWNVY